MTPLLQAIRLVFVLATTAVLGCGGDAPSAGTRSERVFTVETAPAETAEIRVTIEAVGTVQASEEAELRPQADGIVAEVLFAEASAVTKGDMLVRLDDRKAEARLALAQAALDSAVANLELQEQRLRRQRKLIEEALVSREEFDRVQAEHAAAAAAAREQEAAVALAARELEDYQVRAPFTGIIGERLVDVGNYVERGTILAVVMKTRPMKVAFRVPDRHAGTIEPGTAVTILASGDRPPVDGRITFVDPRVDPATRMLSVHATTPNEAGELRHGQFVEVSALIGVRPSQVVIPEEAVLSVAGKTWAYVVEDGVAERRELRLGERRPPQVEVLAGISPQDVLVVGGQHRLADGVRVSTPEPATDGT